MEHIPINILEEVELIRKLQQLHIYSLKDLQTEVLAENDSKKANISKEQYTILEKKMLDVATAIEKGADYPRDEKFIDDFHKLPGNYLTLNGLNLVLGKRGTGKSSFAFLQMLDAFLGYYKMALIGLMQGTLIDDDYKKLLQMKILVFNLRDVCNTHHYNNLLVERAIRFEEKNSDQPPPPPNQSKSGAPPPPPTPKAEYRREIITNFLRSTVLMVSNTNYDSLISMLKEITSFKNASSKDTIDIFGVIIDDISFVFNRIQSSHIKANTRTVGQLCNYLTIHKNIPIVITDSVRNFYDEDTYEDIRTFFPQLLFSSVSDIFYLTKSDQGYLKMAQIKNSKELIPAETKPN